LLLLILIFNTCGRITYWFFQLKKNRKRTTHHPACGGVPLPFCYAKWDDKDLPPPYGGSPSSRKRQDGEASRYLNLYFIIGFAPIILHSAFCILHLQSARSAP